MQKQRAVWFSLDAFATLTSASLQSADVEGVGASACFPPEQLAAPCVHVQWQQACSGVSKVSHSWPTQLQLPCYDMGAQYVSTLLCLYSTLEDTYLSRYSTVYCVVAASAAGDWLAFVMGPIGGAIASFKQFINPSAMEFHSGVFTVAILRALTAATFNSLHGSHLNLAIPMLMADCHR